MPLTSVQETAFNALAEAAADICEEQGLSRLAVGFYPAENTHWYAHADATDSGGFNVSGSGDSVIAAVSKMIAGIAAERDKPRRLYTAKQVQEAAQAILDEYREGESRPFTGAQLDEVADRIAALPIG